MKWIRLGLILIAVLMAALVAFALANAFRTTNPVGFQLIKVPDAAGAPIQVNSEVVAFFAKSL